MSLISATSAGRLLRSLKGIDIRVAPRSERRQTADCERYSLCRFLAAYAGSADLSYPLYVEKRESPDFVLHLLRGCFGLELTEAVPMNWAWASVHRDRTGYCNGMFAQHFQPEEPPRSREDIDDIADGSAMSEGWHGDAPEREWANAMHHFVNKKAALLRQQNGRFDDSWLLIHDNWPVPIDSIASIRKAIGFLMERLSDDRSPFGTVYIERWREVWRLRGGTASVKPIPSIWGPAS